MECLVDLENITVTDDEFIEIAEEIREAGPKFRIMRLEAGWVIRLPLDSEPECLRDEITCQFRDWFHTSGLAGVATTSGSVTSMHILFT